MHSVDEEKNLGGTVVDRETEQDLDARVARCVMGWFRYGGLMHGKPQDVFMTSNGSTRSIYCGCAEDFRPSIDIAAAIEVEDRIAELGKQNDYIAHLWDEVGAARDGSNFWTAQNFNAFWLCVHATPEQRCRAALKATQCLSINDRPADGQASINQTTNYHDEVKAARKEGKGE